MSQDCLIVLVLNLTTCI